MSLFGFEKGPRLDDASDLWTKILGNFLRIDDKNFLLGR